MISALLTDFDGTLFDSRESFILAYNMTLARHNLPMLPRDQTEAINILRKPAEVILRELLGDQSEDPIFMNSFIADLKNCYGDIYLERTKPCPLAIETICRLRTLDLRMAIVSSRRSFADFIQPLLVKHGINGAMGSIITSVDVVATKPSPEPFLLAANRLGVLPGRCIAIGDSPEDVIAGKAAGMLTVAYAGGFYSFQELLRYHADVTTDNFGELVNLAKFTR